MKTRKFFDNLRMTLVMVALVGFGAWGTYDFGPETYRLFFTKPVVCTVPELFNVWETVEAEVTGVVDPGRVLEEKTKNKRTGAAMWRKYYYAFMDKERTTGFYVYSELSPEEFIKRHGTGPITLRGVWEEIPKDIMLQEPMSGMGDMMIYLKENMKGRDADGLFKALDGYRKTHLPIKTGRRLNLQPGRFKLEKAVLMLFFIGMLVAGMAALWFVAGRKGESRMHRIFVLFFMLIPFLTPLHATAGNNIQLPPVSVELRLVEDEPKPGLPTALDPESGTTICLNKNAIIDAGQIMNAKVTIDVLDEPHVEIALNPEASKKFHAFTMENITRKLATLVDGKVVDVAIIREPILSGICEFRTPTRQEAERIVRGIAPPLPSMRGFTPEDVARAYFTALQERGIPIVVDFMHSGEIAKFKSIFMAFMGKMPAAGQGEVIPRLFGKQATLAEVKTLAPKEFMAVFMQNASGLLSQKGFTFEKLEVIGSIPEGDLRHVVSRIEIGIRPAAMKKMEVVSMKRDGAEWKLMLTKEFDGLLQMMESDLQNK